MFYFGLFPNLEGKKKKLEGVKVFSCHLRRRAGLVDSVWDSESRPVLGCQVRGKRAEQTENEGQCHKLALEHPKVAFRREKSEGNLKIGS